MDTFTLENETAKIIEDSEDLSKLHDIIENIELLTPDYLQKVKAETITELTQQQYLGYLTHIYLFYIKPTKILYKHYQGISNNKQITLQYNDNLLYMLSEYYIYISLNYNKVCNIYGFATLTGIDLNCFERWEKQESQRPQAYRLVKRLQKAYETSLENGAQSGKNPVGFIATLNHRFGWSADNKPTLTVNITRTKQEILSGVDQSLLIENPTNP